MPAIGYRQDLIDSFAAKDKKPALIPGCARRRRASCEAKHYRQAIDDLKRAIALAPMTAWSGCGSRKRELEPETTMRWRGL